MLEFEKVVKCHPLDEAKWYNQKKRELCHQKDEPQWRECRLDCDRPPHDPSPDPNPKPSLNEQIADIALKVIMTGGVAGGGLGAFWSLFKDSDVPKAIASAGIGLAISYAAKMLQPIHKGTERRLEKLGEAADRGIDRVGEVVAAKITSVEDRYVESQTAECETCSTEGMGKISGIFTPMLNQVFVPLELDRSALSPGWGTLEADDPSQRLEPPTVDIWRLLARAKRDPIYSQIAILAWGGYGKTTLLRHITYTLGRNQQPHGVPRFLPVLLLLRKYRDLLTQDNRDDIPDLPTLIETHHIPSLPATEALQMPTNWARERLNQGRVVDGFDEVPKAKRPLLARWLNAQLRAYNRSVFILTSRPKAYTEQDASDRLDFNTLLWVRQFSPQQGKEFVQKWYWCQEYYHHGKTDTPAVRKVAADSAAELWRQIAARPELTDLAKNPLLLNMIAMFHRRYPSAELPKRRVELYQEMCLLQLRDRPGARRLETLLADCDAQIILQMLDLEMMQQKEERVEQDTVLERLTRYLADQDETVAAPEFLKQVEQISELLVQREPEEFEFAHLSFQEFLAAREVVRLKHERLLYDHFGEDWWKSTILLYAAQVKKPSSLIRAALAAGATDLAHACWQETSKRIDTDLQKDLEEIKALQEGAAAVQTSRYQQLEEYLKTQQWREADEETYRLMITTVGKEVGQWFDRADLENFPCADLRTLDHLWVNYSKTRDYPNGKWGFSVQKQIWQECGSPMEYNDDWEKFGDRVGWRKDGDWVDYNDLTFDLQKSLAGEFPLLLWSVGRGRRRWAVVRGRWLGAVGFLFSRATTCRL